MVTVTVAVQCTAVCILPVRLLVGALQSLNVDLEALSCSVIKLLEGSDIFGCKMQHIESLYNSVCLSTYLHRWEGG